jgi:hypothetical protein
MVKKILPFVGTRPFFFTSFGFILTKASSGNAEKALKAWSAKIFLSAKNKIRGLRLPSRFKFQRV